MESKKKNGYPDSQPFNVEPKPNKKKHSWYKTAPYHNNRMQSRVDSGSKVQH